MTAPATKLAALPPGAATGTVTVGSDKPAPPPTGWIIRQLTGGSRVTRHVHSIIGVFNPTYVGLARRLQMMQDPTVSFGLSLLRACVTNSDYVVKGNDAKVKAFVEQVLDDVYYDMAMGMSNAIPLGYQVAEKEWNAGPYRVTVDDKADGSTSSFDLSLAWTLKRVKALDPRATAILIDEANDDFGGVQGHDFTGKLTNIGLDKALLWSFRKELVWGRLTGWPVTDIAYQPWWSKVATELFCDRYYERKADPSYKAHVPASIDGPDGTKIDGFQFMQMVMQGLKNGETITLPGEVDEKGNRIVDVEVLADDKRGDMFHQRLEYLNLQILRAMLIADRAGSAGRGSGIGTGEAAVHFEILQMMLEEILTEWAALVNEHVVKPLVVFNFGQQVYDESETCFESKGLSNWLRDLYRVILQQLSMFETALADGKVVRCFEYIDFVSICQALKVPLKSADQIGPLAHKRIDPGPIGGGAPIGNPGDSNVKGQGGAKPGQNTKDPNPQGGGY